MDTVLDVIKILQALKEGNHKDRDIKKILGGNFIRVLEKVIEN